MQRLEINGNFLNHIFKLRQTFKNTDVTEIRITASQISFYDAQGEPAHLTFSSDITMNTFTRAMNLYMEDIKRTKISIRFPEEVVGNTWAERFSFICRKILSGIRNQVVLLQFYYYLGECLEEMAWSSAARDNI